MQNDLLARVEAAGFDLAAIEAALNARKGAVKSEAKAKTAAANGKLGGRPAIRKRAVMDAKVYSELHGLATDDNWIKDAFDIFVQEANRSAGWAAKNFSVYENTFKLYLMRKRSEV